MFDEKVFLANDCALPYLTQVFPANANDSGYILASSERCSILVADAIGRSLYSYIRLILVASAVSVTCFCIVVLVLRARVVYLENERNRRSLLQDVALKFLIRIVFGGFVFAVFVADPGNVAGLYSWFQFIPLFIVQFQALSFITTYVHIWRVTLEDLSTLKSNNNLNYETRFLHCLAFADCVIASLPSRKMVFDNIVYSIHGVLITAFFLLHFVFGFKVFRSFLKSDQEMSKSRRASVVRTRTMSPSTVLKLFSMIVVCSICGIAVGISLSLSWLTILNPKEFVTETELRRSFLRIIPLYALYMFASFCVTCSYIRVRSSQTEILRVEPKVMDRTSTRI